MPGNILNLLPPQQEILESGLLDSGFHCILQMPTGSGKTWLAEQAMAEVLAQGLRVIYVAPLRALVNELGQVWQRRFPEHRIGLFTGDYGASSRAYPVPFHEAQLLVMTPERLDLCTRSWRNHWPWIPQVDLVVVDEFHLLGDSRRGARLEGALSRFQRLNPFARLLCLSATLGNLEQLANWLDAVAYQSSWRPIPLHWRIVRFRKMGEKLEILQQVLAECTGGGGKSLIFVQSRRRAEQLSQALQTAGFRAVHHHAGIDQQTRQRIEEGFRAQTYDVLVATSTLEMGVNLPVRQVVLYDLQRFDGQRFSPLLVNSVWQRVGRAGRPQLDTSGEAVLLAPTWDREVDHYLKGIFEPIHSLLGDERALGEQIVVEVAGRYVRTRNQVKQMFSRCLAAYQGQLHPRTVGSVLETLLESGMLIEDRDNDDPEAPLRLRVTKLGRVSVRHRVYPATVLRFMQSHAIPDLTFLDLLLLVTSTFDCEPVLTVDFEELEILAQRLSAEPSRLLSKGRVFAEKQLGVSGRRLLSALKMALAVRMLTRQDDSDVIADTLGCYPFELNQLADAVRRLLLAFHDLISTKKDTEQPDAQARWQTEQITLAERVQVLQQMVASRLDEQAVSLMLVKGLGTQFARRLVERGIGDIETLARADSEHVGAVPGISHERAARWIDHAQLIMLLRDSASYQENGPCPRFRPDNQLNSIDPYRLKRARELRVVRIKPSRFRVTGGSDPHIVRQLNGNYRCDCGDYRQGQRQCKHVLAVRLHQRDKTLQPQAQKIKPLRVAHAEWNLLALWTEDSGAALPVVRGWR